MRRRLSAVLLAPVLAVAGLLGAAAPARAVDPANDWQSVAVGAGVSCGIRTDTSLWCWGTDGLDELGDGPGKVDRPYPTRLGTVATATGWTSVAVGGKTSCAIRNGQLYCWGVGSQGALGAGTGRTASPGPGLVDAVYWTWTGFRAVRWTTVSPGGWRTCGVGTGSDGLWCWGLGSDGLLGDGGTSDVWKPVQVAYGSWRSVSTGHFHTCAIDGGGALWCWGSNGFGQVGDGTTTSRPRPVRIGTRTDWASVSAGGYFTCALTTAGERWCWGRNASGELGDGTTTPRTVPTRIGAQLWSGVSAGASSACGTSAGQGWCWGSNPNLLIRLTSDPYLPNPTRIGPATAVWTDLQVGRGYTTTVACGRQRDGGAWCFGSVAPSLGNGGSPGWATGDAPVRVLG